MTRLEAKHLNAGEFQANVAIAAEKAHWKQAIAEAKFRLTTATHDAEMANSRIESKKEMAELADASGSPEAAIASAKYLAKLDGEIATVKAAGEKSISDAKAELKVLEDAWTALNQEIPTDAPTVTA